MKKLFYLLMAVALISLAACSKDEDEPNGQNGSEENQISLVGNWEPTENAYYKVMMYDSNGAFYDSIMTPLDSTAFNFISETQCATPWGITASYTYENNQITFNLMGVVNRVYDVVSLTANSLVMEYRDTSEYRATADGVTYTLVGYELEHWDLRKTSK